MMRFAPIAIAITAAACTSSPDAIRKSMDSLAATYAPPEHLPVMLNHELPFHYPDALFSQKIQANVVLGIYIDTTGMVWPESTKVLQSSGYAQLDTAAVRGAPQLKFKPAMTKGKPVPVMIKLPVYFRYPGAPPLPGDSVLEPKAAPAKTP
jgi:TonB family protein